jgi:tRNA (pseudouridine54-N1)-methyltransferase
MLRHSISIIGDHMGVTEDEESIIEKYASKTLNIGPLSLHSDHCITIILNEIDRAGTDIK